MDNIRVIGRFRPSNEVEMRDQKKKKYKDTPPDFSGSQIVKLARPTKTREKFKGTLDHFFKPTVTQKKVFDLVGRPMVSAVLDGYNATIFAYGQTGSGKTFTVTCAHMCQCV